jgi:dihydroxyacetone kinase-like protein
MLLFVATQVISNKDTLSDADRVIGDGDHGVAMARGFEAVERRLSDSDFGDLQSLFDAVGMALLTSIGGASGVVFGTWFRNGARELAGSSSFDTQAIRLLLRGGLKGVQERGKAQAGDKTMVDVLIPAVEAIETYTGEDVRTALSAVMGAAEEGMSRTKDMVATKGKAKSLGDRSRGFPDPGAISTYLILKAMHDYLARE